MISNFRQRFYQDIPITPFTRAQVNALKGLLILLVVIGHLRGAFMGTYSEFFSGIYNFHVLGFLILPFLYPIKALRAAQIIDWARRFYMPFGVFFILYTILNILHVQVVPPGTDIARALLLQTSLPLEAVNGTQILWFLPALFLMMICISAMLHHLRLPLLILFGGAATVQAAAALLPREFAFNIPLSGILVAYIFLNGLILRGAVLMLKNARRGLVFAASLITFAVLQFASWYFELYIGAAGFYLPPYSDPLRVLVCSGILISAVMAGLHAPFIAHYSPLQILGGNSLLLYLLHQPLLMASWMILQAHLPLEIAGIICVMIALSGALCGVWCLRKIPYLKSKSY